MLLTDRTVLVSGVGPGVGAELAVAAAREGADVVLAARSASMLEETAGRVQAHGRRAVAVPTDVTDPAQCERLVAAARGELGRIDVLVHNAFLSNPVALVEQADLDDWRRIFEVNLFGAIRLTQLVAPLMRVQKRGSIVFVNSMSIRIIEPMMGGYAASKGALLTAARTLAKELGPDGIRVNSIVPGYIWSAKMEAYFRKMAADRGVPYEAVHGDVTSRTALHHIPDSAEVADAAIFFASDLSRAVTGQSLDVNGGHYFD